MILKKLKRKCWARYFLAGRIYGLDTMVIRHWASNFGALSGAALFFRAVTDKDKTTEETGRGTLWGLFILCTIEG